MQNLTESCQEIWLESAEGSLLCALINDSVGWLMYVTQLGAEGFSSRNAFYDGPSDSEIAYQLENGQIDHYPASWALPIAKVEMALSYFRSTSKQSPDIDWHNDTNWPCGRQAFS